VGHKTTTWSTNLVAIFAGTRVDVRAVAGDESLKADYTQQDSKLGFVVNAIHTMAHALDAMFRDVCGTASRGLCAAMKPVNGSEFLRYLLNASFVSYSGDLVTFDAAGDPPAR